MLNPSRRMLLISLAAFSTGAPPVTAQSTAVSVFDEAVAIIRGEHPAPARLIGSEVFDSTITEIRSTLGANSTDTALAVAIMRVLHLVGDGHSNLWIDEVEPFDMMYPVRFTCEAQELRVQSVFGLDESALGAAVLRMNGRDIGEVRDLVLEICSGDNAYFAWATAAPRLLQHPRIAMELGLAGEDGRLDIDVETLAGERLSLELEPGPEPTRWTHLQFPTGPDEILYLRNRERAHWVTTLPEVGAVYAQYNQVNNGEPTTESFAAAIDEALTKSGADKLIVDVRRNGGGNNFRNQPIQHAILKSSVNRPGHLFVLTSPRTFSACVNFCGWLERETFAIFVGEPTGAPPNMYGDARQHALGRDGWMLFVSAWYWQEAMPWDRRLFIQPHIEARTRIPDMFESRDPVLEAAIDFDDPVLVELLRTTQPRSHASLDGQLPAVEARASWPKR